MFKEQKCSSFTNKTIHYKFFIMRYVIRGFKGPKIQNFDRIYLKKDKYFKKQYRIKDA